MATPSKDGATMFTTPSVREIVMTRVVDAPRSLDFEAWTNPSTCRTGCSARKA
jgi:hypothetical protein